MSFFYFIGSASSKNYLNFKDNNGIIFFLKKSSICWLLKNNESKVSSSRLERFRNARDTTFFPETDVNGCEVREEISVGDWCVFCECKNCTVRQIIGFKYLSGRDSSYSLISAPVKPPSSSKGRGVGVWEIFLQ